MKLLKTEEFPGFGELVGGFLRVGGDAGRAREGEEFGRAEVAFGVAVGLLEPGVRGQRGPVQFEVELAVVEGQPARRGVGEAAVEGVEAFAEVADGAVAETRQRRV